MQSLTGANVRLRQEISPGRFYIDGIDDGIYLVHISNTRIDSPSAAAIIEAGDRDIDDLHLTLRDPLDIRVETRIAEPDAKLAESLYLLLSSSDGSGRDFLIKGDGPGHHLRVPAGEYIPLIQTHRPGFAVASVTYAGRPVDYYMPIGIETPESVITVTLTSRPGRITGTVRSFDQNPAPGATIVLLPAAIAASIEQADPGSPREMIRMAQVLKYAAEWKIAKSDSTGALHFDDLAPGEYRAVVLGTDDGRNTRDLVSMRDHLRDATRVTVEASQTANLQLQIR